MNGTGAAPAETAPPIRAPEGQTPRIEGKQDIVQGLSPEQAAEAAKFGEEIEKISQQESPLDTIQAIAGEDRHDEQHNPFYPRDEHAHDIDFSTSNPEDLMREKLKHLPALNRESDSRWRQVYDTIPDYFKDQPPPSAGDVAFEVWRDRNHALIQEYRLKADEALRAQDPAAFSLYEKYGVYATPDGKPNPNMDPEASYLFLDKKNQPRSPSQQEIDDFKSKYPEKAAFYDELFNGIESNSSEFKEQQPRVESHTSTVEENNQIVTPIEILKINSNWNMEGRKYDSNKISFEQRGDSVQFFLDGNEWYAIPGNLKETTIDNTNFRFVFATSENAPHAMYEPATDAYTIGPSGVEMLQTDHESFMADLLHEMGHDAYFSLSEESQRDLNDLILHDPDLNELFRQFATALYTDSRQIGQSTSGEQYLGVHKVNNEGTKKNTLSNDGEKGLKDKRSMVIKVNGQQEEVFVGLLATEFFSYMSTLEVSQEVFDKRAAIGRSLRGGKAPRYDVTMSAFQTIKNSPELKARIDRFGLFDHDPDFKQEILDFLKKSTNSEISSVEQAVEQQVSAEVSFKHPDELDSLIRARAKEIWQRNGARENQAEEEQNKDWEEAKNQVYGEFGYDASKKGAVGVSVYTEEKLDEMAQKETHFISQDFGGTGDKVKDYELGRRVAEARVRALIEPLTFSDPKSFEAKRTELIQAVARDLKTGDETKDWLIAEKIVNSRLENKNEKPPTENGEPVKSKNSTTLESPSTERVNVDSNEAEAAEAVINNSESQESAELNRNTVRVPKKIAGRPEFEDVRNAVAEKFKNENNGQAMDEDELNKKALEAYYTNAAQKLLAENGNVIPKKIVKNALFEDIFKKLLAEKGKNMQELKDADIVEALSTYLQERDTREDIIIEDMGKMGMQNSEVTEFLLDNPNIYAEYTAGKASDPEAINKMVDRMGELKKKMEKANGAEKDKLKLTFTWLMLILALTTYSSIKITEGLTKVSPK